MMRGRVATALAAGLVLGAFCAPAARASDPPASPFTALRQFSIPSGALANAPIRVDPTRHLIYARYGSGPVVAVNYNSQHVTKYGELLAKGMVLDPTSGDLYAYGTWQHGGQQTDLAVIRNKRILAEFPQTALGGQPVAAVPEFDGRVAVLVSHAVAPHHVILRLVELVGTKIVTATAVCDVEGATQRHQPMAFDTATGRLYIGCPAHGQDRPDAEMEIYRAGDQIGTIDSVPRGRLVMDSAHSWLYVLGHGTDTVIRGFHVAARLKLPTQNGAAFQIHTLLLDPTNGNLYVGDGGRRHGATGPQLAILHGPSILGLGPTYGDQLAVDPTSGLIYVSREPAQTPDADPSHGVLVFDGTTLQTVLTTQASMTTFDATTGDVLGLDPQGMATVRGETVGETVSVAAASPEKVVPVLGHPRVLTIGGGWVTVFKTAA